MTRELSLELLGWFGVAAILVDKDCRFLDANGVGRRVIGRIEAPFGGDPEHFLDRIDRKLIPMIQSPPAKCVFLSRGRIRPLAIVAYPIPPAPNELDQVIVLGIFDLQYLPAPRRTVLRSAFGLTKTETEVARRLGLGMSIAQIAEDLGSAVGTIRTQLKSIFMKTETNRQAELSAVIWQTCVLPGHRVERAEHIHLHGERSGPQRGDDPAST